MKDRVMGWAICLVPRFICQWLWSWSEEHGIGLGVWGPHVFGRCLGVGGRRIK